MSRQPKNTDCVKSIIKYDARREYAEILAEYVNTIEYSSDGWVFEHYDTAVFCVAYDYVLNEFSVWEKSFPYDVQVCRPYGYSGVDAYAAAVAMAIDNSGAAIDDDTGIEVEFLDA